MDTITHVALGACIGEVLATKKLGKKALLWGAAAQNIPDIDVLCSLWMDPSSNLLAHRGFTHSFLFAAIISIVLAWLAHRKSRSQDTSFKFWAVFFGVQIFGHTLLDGFNAYGTGWFEPFSHYRVSFHTLFVIDPFYVSPLGIGSILLLFLRIGYAKRRHLAFAAIIISTLYVGHAVINKFRIERVLQAAVMKHNISPTKHFTTPTPFNSWLWLMVASNKAGSYIAYRSVFDAQEAIKFEFFPRYDSLLALAASPDEVDRLKRFSQDFYTLERRGDTLVFNDLRFGQMGGWKDPRVDFTFHYYLRPSLDNKLVMQRGRFSGWDQGTMQAFIQRIEGIK